MSPTTASIRDRLLNRARAEGADFQLFLDRYPCERFLYRLGQSYLRERLILKGATLLSIWMEEPYRSTRDIDLLAMGANDEDTIKSVMETVCTLPCPEDGLDFDLDRLNIHPIREGQVYEGQRARLPALLGNARATVQVDFGFGDAVTPQRARMPTLIDDLPAPDLRVYPLVSVIAEKFEAMVNLGIRNTRMKDFYDIWALSETFDIDGPALREAIARCFDRRGTEWTQAVPDPLTPEFYSDTERQHLWRALGNAGMLLEQPQGPFEDTGLRVRTLFGPVRDSILSGDLFEMNWPAGGPWK